MYKEDKLIDYLDKIYDEVCRLHANLGFLHSYCYAYSTLDSVYYLVPNTRTIVDSLELIAEDLREITGNSKSVKNRTCFISDLIKDKYSAINIINNG